MTTTSETAYEKFMRSHNLTQEQRDLIEFASALRAKETLEGYVRNVFDNALYIRQQSKTFFLKDDMFEIKNRMINK